MTRAGKINYIVFLDNNFLLQFNDKKMFFSLQQKTEKITSKYLKTKNLSSKNIKQIHAQ